MHGPNGLSQFRREPGRAGDSWSNAVFKSNHYGKPLYTKAKELNFDAPFVRETVRCLMRFALGNVETGYMALYCDRKMEHGTQYDDEGNLIMPQMDFVVTCLPRSAFHMASEGYACAPTDVGLDWIVSGGGSAELPEVEGLNYMRRMVMGGPMGTSYELHLLSTLPKEMRGKKRKSYYCGEPCECQIYETYVRNVNIGHFGLRASEGENGEMR